MVSQEPGNPTDAATAVPSSPGQLPQSPFPHCKLASAQQRASAAASVEAVQQEDDDDEDDVQGNLTSQTGRGVSSTPTTSSAQRPKPNSLYGILPVAPTSRQRMPAFYNAADRSGLEHALSGMCDSEYQHHPASPASQQLSGISHTQRNHKRHKADSGEVLPALRPASALLLAPECSGASQGCSQAASQQGICQAAPETTQQATIEEVRECY